MYNTNRTSVTLPIETREIRITTIDFSLGDILPKGMNYVDRDDVDLRITMHYVDVNGRNRHKTWTLPSTDLEGTF